MNEAFADWSGFTGYKAHSTVDLEALTAESLASHVFNVLLSAFSILDCYDMLVALGGERLDLGRASGADSAAAPEAVASPPPDLRPPSEGSASPSPRGSMRPPQDRHQADETKSRWLQFPRRRKAVRRRISQPLTANAGKLCHLIFEIPISIHAGDLMRFFDRARASSEPWTFLSSQQCNPVSFHDLRSIHA